MYQFGKRQSSIQPNTEEASFFGVRFKELANLLSCSYQTTEGNRGFWMNRREKVRFDQNQKRAQVLVEEMLNFFQAEPSKPVEKDGPPSYIRDESSKAVLPEARACC